MNLSNTFVRVVLPSGDAAIYEAQPNHFIKRCSNISINQQIMDYGKQIAVCINGVWHIKQKPVNLEMAVALEKITGIPEELETTA